MLQSFVKHDLEANADAKNRSATSQATLNHPGRADPP